MQKCTKNASVSLQRPGPVKTTRGPGSNLAGRIRHFRSFSLQSGSVCCVPFDLVDLALNYSILAFESAFATLDNAFRGEATMQRCRPIVSWLWFFVYIHIFFYWNYFVLIFLWPYNTIFFYKNIYYSNKYWKKYLILIIRIICCMC